MYLKQIQEAWALATPVPHEQTAPDTSPAFVLQYVPANGVSSAYRAKIALVQDGDMTFTTGAAGVTAVGDSNATADGIGTAGVIDTSAAAYDTVGDLLDYINGHPAWRGYLVGALRSDGMETILAKTADWCDVANGLTFYSDTSASEHIDVAISGEKFVNNGINGHVKDVDDMCENVLLSLSVQQDMASAGTLTLYSSSQGSSPGDSTLWSAALADDTLTEKGYDQPESVWARATRGSRLIVRVAHATDIGAGAVTKFHVVGKTAVLKNNRLVSEKNY